MGTRNVFGACVSGFFAIGMLVAGVQGIYQEVRIDATGRPAVATVVAADLDSRDPSVTVRLARPAPEIRVDLTSWAGDPQVGDVMHVRYAAGDAHLAKQQGTFSWWDVVLPFPIAAVMALVCWDAVRFLRRRNRDDLEPGWWERLWDGDIQPRDRHTQPRADG